MRTMLILTILCSTSAYAADEINVTTGSKSMKVGAEFRAELNRNDQGLKKTDDNTPDATTNVQVQTARLKVSGKIEDNTDYKFRFNFLNPKDTPLDYGYVLHWFGDTVGLGFGKMKVMQGGWDTYDDHFTDHWKGAYADNLPVGKYSPVIALHAKVAGQIIFQLFNDVTTADKGQWNKTEHPTFALGWLGSLGMVSPTVMLGSYDNNKSRWLDVGAKVDIAGVKARLDLRDEVISAKGVDDDGKAKSEDDKASAATLYVAYAIKDVATPWFYFSTYERKEFADKDAGKEDVKTNTIDVDADGKATYKFDDNKQVIGLGANIASGNGWTPYVAFLSNSGKFADPTSGDEEKKTETQLRLGVLAEL